MALRRALARIFGPERRVWRGQASLRLVFWGYGVAVSVALAVLFTTAYALHETGLLQVLIILSALYTMWILVGIWRCAANSTQVWADIARLVTVAWALNTSFVLMFLQTDLLLTYLAN